MIIKTLRVFPANLRHVKQMSLAYGSASQPRKPLGSRMMIYARLVSHKGMISMLRPSGGTFSPQGASQGEL